MEIKNFKKATHRLLKAIKDRESIILYGDADMDGVASVIILEETIKILGGSVVQVYFPDREKEGYGINESALAFLKKFSPALLIAVDLGIGNVKEVDLAKKMGIEVIIIDHHKILPEIPKASIIINPKQKEDKFPFKKLAAAGIVYKFSKVLLSEAGRSYEPEQFLELAALATIADMMPLIDENKKIVEQGILAIDYTKRKGLKILMEKMDYNFGDFKEIWNKILSPLSAAGFQNHLQEAYLLLTENSSKKAKVLAELLIKKNKQKKEEVKRIYQETEARVEERELPEISIIFEGNSSWSLTLLGTVASRICQKYKSPTFLFKIKDKESVGTVRVPSSRDAVEAMESCRGLLETYGGHALAAGFRVKNENLEKFKDCLIEYFNNLRSES